MIGDQWHCTCGWGNFFMRSKCRSCGKAKPSDAALHEPFAVPQEAYTGTGSREAIREQLLVWGFHRIGYGDDAGHGAYHEWWQSRLGGIEIHWNAAHQQVGSADSVAPTHASTEWAPIRGFGTDAWGGFTSICVGETEYAADQVRAALSPSRREFAPPNAMKDFPPHLRHHTEELIGALVQAVRSAYFAGQRRAAATEETK